MSDDAKAILLLCGRLGKETDSKPLQPSEYNRLVRWLVQANLRPADLLSPENVKPAAMGSELPEARLAALLKRGVQLGFAVETWNRSNIWVICRSDPDYPARYRNHLKEQAPPILFGVGERSLLKGGGMAIVGSRNIDEEAERFTETAAAWCARGGLPVVSGGARGVDQIAMKGALDAGGCVVGVLAENLLKNSVAREARKAISDGTLLLISPYHPEARFTVGTAMARNKLIYAMADYGLVVSSDHKKGGTWAGAAEELKRKTGRPVFVRMTGSVPVGNPQLIKLGAVTFPEMSEASPETSLRKALERKPKQKAEEMELALFDEPAVVREKALSEDKGTYGTSQKLEQKSSPIYEAVLPVLQHALEKPATVDELTKTLDVAKGQLQIWLKQAVRDQKIKKLNKPVRYVRK
ncbi:MAG: DNA-protecting protein DprA [Verrucomicrobia bacterium]|nr:DNA-protecting protein DprA [Verrucomicrobiota bacterium]MCH8512258.1 DNA-processing protein DprA [Kiritimatiellia bacterium]